MNMKNKKALAAALIAVAAVCVIAAVIIIIVNISNSRGTAEQTETTAAVTVSESSTAEPETAVSSSAETAAQEPHTHGEQQTTVNIVLPTSGGEITHFSGSYVPDGKAEDIATGKAVPMRELFGTGYADSAITFNEDGSFTDGLVASVPKNGKYNVEDGAITAVYLPDESLDITVTEWDAESGAPVTFCVVYNTVGDHGYRVFFSKKA